MKKIITITLALGLSSLLMADANIPVDKKAMKAKMTEMAGENSKFNSHEHFPKDYFLVPKNLPFALNLTLHHPQSSTLELSKEQIEKLVNIKKERKPLIIKGAKEIKALELSLVKLLESDEGKKKEVTKEMNELVDKIAGKKAELTKGHLQCIIDVQNVLTEEQRKKVGAYVGKKAQKGEKQHKVAELVALPHPVKIVLMNKEPLNLTKEQSDKVDAQMLAIFPSKIHGAMDKAEPIEAKITNAVLNEQKTKEDLKADIEALIDIKRGMTNDHIDALNTLYTILTKEQYQKMLDISAKRKKGQKHKH
jgi:hypothetical protein